MMTPDDFMLLYAAAEEKKATMDFPFTDETADISIAGLGLYKFPRDPTRWEFRISYYFPSVQKSVELAVVMKAGISRMQVIDSLRTHYNSEGVFN